MDPKHGILHFAQVAGESVDRNTVAKAVKDAGYKPHFIYKLKGGKVVKTLLDK